METLWWILTLLVMFLGLLGTVLPLLPGTTLIFAAAVFHRLMFGPAASLGWGSLAGLLVLLLLSQAIELLSGAVGAKYFGASRWGAIGGILGGVIGLFFGLIGIFVGPLLGVLAGELLGGKGLLPAGRSTWGTVLGTTAGMVGKFAIGVAMVLWFLLAVWL